MVSGNVVNSTFKNNYATNFGGALVNAYSLNCTFIKNSAKNGGAIYQGSAKNCTFNENYASENGGASYESSSCDSSIFIIIIKKSIILIFEIVYIFK